MAESRFFKRGREAKAAKSAVRQTAGPLTRPAYGKRVSITLASGQTRVVSTGFALQQLGRSKGGQLTGPEHQFTSATGSAAVRKRWERHPVTRTGMRLGARLVRRKAVKREPLRQHYASNPTRGIRYVNGLGWFYDAAERGQFVQISERTALKRLGHIPTRTKRIMPIAIEPFAND